MFLILGTVSSDDPVTQRKLLHQIGMTIKTESGFTSTTSVTKTAKCPKASAAAGSMAQLERVESEMKAETVTTTSYKTQPHKTPMVETCPFEVRI